MNWGGFSFGVRSVTTPSTVRFTSGNRTAPHGRSWLMVNIEARNGRTSTVLLTGGGEYAVETDAGIAYSWNADIEIPPRRYAPNGLNLLFDIPSNASTAVVALEAADFPEWQYQHRSYVAGEHPHSPKLPAGTTSPESRTHPLGGSRP